MAYDVVATRSAARELRGLPGDVRRLLGAKIDALATDPRPSYAEKLAGYDRLYRIRQGDYRVVYEVDDAQQVVTLALAGHRRDIYRVLRQRFG